MLKDCKNCISHLADMKKPTKIVDITNIETGQKTVILTNFEEEPNWKAVAMEFKCYPATMGSFHRLLCEAIVRADITNTEKLRKSYPKLVQYLKGEAESCPQI